MQFLWAISKGEGVFNKNMTLVLLGDGEAGKTSVFRALRDDKADLIQEDHRTVGIDLNKWKAADDVDFRVMDLAGQALYEASHQFFLQRRAVYLLVWRAFPLQDGRLGLLTERIRHWLEGLQLRMPGACVMVVVTHIFSVTSASLDNQCSVVKETVQKCLDAMEKWQKKSTDLLQIFRGGECQRVDCLVGTGIKILRERLLGFTRSMPWYGEALPISWMQTIMKVEDKIQAGKKHVTLSEWTTMAKECGMEGAMLQIGTKFLHETGVIRFFGDFSKVVSGVVSNESVFLDISWMVSVLKGLVRHERQALQDFFIAQEDKPMLRRISRLNTTARLHETLIPFLWPSSKESETFWKWVQTDNSREQKLWPSKVISSSSDLASAVELLEGFGMMAKDRVNSEYLVPAVLPIGKTKVQFQAYCEFPLTLETNYAKFPLGAFQQVVVRVGAWASEMEFTNKVAVCYWRGNIGKLCYVDNGPHTGCLKVDERSEGHRKVSVRISSSGKAMLERMKAELVSVEAFFDGLSCNGHLVPISSGPEAVQVTILGLENEYLDMMERVLKAVFNGDDQLVLEKCLISHGGIEKIAVERLRAVLLITTPKLLSSTTAMQQIMDLIKREKNCLKSSQVIPVLMNGLRQGLGRLVELQEQVCDMRFCTNSEFLQQKSQESEAIHCAQKLLKQPILDILHAWRINIVFNKSLPGSMQCQKCSHNLNFSRSDLLKMREEAQSQHNDKASICCTSTSCHHLNLLNDLLVIPEVCPCPACTKHAEVNPGIFNTRVCHLSFGENLLDRNPSLTCQVCEKAGRPGKIHVLDVCPPDVFVSLHSPISTKLEDFLRGIESKAKVLMWAGRKGNQEDLAALERASVVVTIFSDKYFRSHRCISELRAALLTGKLVIPLLNTMDDNWSGSFGQDYWKHAATLQGSSVSDWSMMNKLKPLLLSSLENPEHMTNQVVGLIIPRIHRAVNLRVFSEMPLLGLRLTYLKTFIQQCGGREVLKGKSTLAVMLEFVKPGTKDTHVSWCEKLISEGNTNEWVGMATWFVSHAWTYPFLVVVDTLETYFVGKKDPVIWFDVFSVSQHQTDERSFDWWNTTFLNAVGQIGQMVMVVLDWEHPATLSRVWCIFEVFAAFCTSSSFHIAMPGEVAEKFVGTMLTEGSTAAVLRLLECIQCESAQASMATDRDLILDTVRRTVGLDKLDSLVISVMYKAFLDMLQSRVAALLVDSTQNGMILTLTLARFHWLFRNGEGTLRNLEKLRNMDWGAVNCGADIWQDVLVMLADVLCQNGRLSEACQLLESQWPLWHAGQVASEAGALSSSSNKHVTNKLQAHVCAALAWVAAQSGRLEEAHTQLRAWQVSRAIGGSIDTAADNLAVGASAILNSAEEVKEVLFSVLDQRAANLGIYHPDTLDAMLHVATIAAPADHKMLQACLRRQERMLGHEHQCCQRTRAAISSITATIDTSSKVIVEEERTSNSSETTTLESVWASESKQTPLVISSLVGNLGSALKKMVVKRPLILGLCHVEEWMDVYSMTRLLRHLFKDLDLQGLTLDLRKNSIKVEGWREVMDALKLVTSLTTFNGFNVSNMRVGGLTNVDLQGKLREEGLVTVVSQYLPHSASTLTQLDLSENFLGPEGGTVISSALGQLTALQILELNDNCLKAEGGTAISSALVWLTALQTLNLHDNCLKAEGGTAISSALVLLTALQTLILHDNCLKAEGGTAISSALVQLTALQTLNLYTNSLGPQGAAAMAPVLANLANLELLYISGNSLGPHGAEALLPALAKMIKLRVLHIGYNDGLGCQGATHVAKALPGMTSLTFLSIFRDGSGIGDEGCAAVKAVVLPALKKIY